MLFATLTGHKELISSVIVRKFLAALSDSSRMGNRTPLMSVVLVNSSFKKAANDGAIANLSPTEVVH